MRSLLAHQMELKSLITNLEKRGSTLDAILLSETFLTKKTEKLVSLQGYTLLSNPRMNHKRGGTGILLKQNIPCRL